MITLPLMFLLLILVLYQYGFVAIREKVESIKEEQSIKERTLQKYVDIISEKPRLEQTQLSLAGHLKDLESRFIEGQTSAVASANLQAMIKDIAAGVKGTVVSERIGKVEDLGRFKVIKVGVDMNLPDIVALNDLIHSIESRQEHIVISDIDIRLKNFRAPRELLVRLDVSAIIKGR